MKELYFDASSTTQVRPQVIKEMARVIKNNYANPSSTHAKGNDAFQLITKARTTMARAIGAKAHEIVFTSGTTESNNWVFQGLGQIYPNKRKIIISSIEHPSVREVCNHLKKYGFEIVEIPVNSEGYIDINFLEKAIDNNTLVVSVMHANNIFGTIQDLKKIGDTCKSKNTLFHTDAAQTLGKEKILVHDWNIDLLSASAHKIGGPKGIGILYVREGIKLTPLMFGGGQEKNMRSGTENTAGIAGFAKALEIAGKHDWKKTQKLRDELIDNLEELGAKIIGTRKERLSNNIFATFNVDAETLLYQLSAKGIYVSVGSACDSKKESEDAALKAIGMSKEDAKKSLRISIPMDTSTTDIKYFVKVLKELLR